jgi:hypothetical protein
MAASTTAAEALCHRAGLIEINLVIILLQNTPSSFCQKGRRIEESVGLSIIIIIY